MTMDEHEDCDRQLNEAEDKIITHFLEQTKRIKELENLLEQLIFIAEKATIDDSEDTTIELAKQALKGSECGVTDGKDIHTKIR